MKNQENRKFLNFLQENVKEGKMVQKRAKIDEKSRKWTFSGFFFKKPMGNCRKKWKMMKRVKE
jgi:hypothetical protein